MLLRTISAHFFAKRRAFGNILVLCSSTYSILGSSCWVRDCTAVYHGRLSCFCSANTCLAMLLESFLACRLKRLKKFTNCFKILRTNGLLPVSPYTAAFDVPFGTPRVHFKKLRCSFSNGSEVLLPFAYGYNFFQIWFCIF